MLNELENEKIQLNEFGFEIFGKQFKTGLCKIVNYQALLFHKSKYRLIFVYKPKWFRIPNILLYYEEPMYVIKMQFLFTLGMFFAINKKPKINPLWLEIFIKLLINIVLLYYVMKIIV